MTFKIFSKLGVQKAWDYRSEPESMRLLATVFWRTMIVVGLLLFLLALWFGYQELDVASQANNVTSTVAAAKQPWTPAQLQSTLDSFAQKQAAYKTLASSSLPAVADPSK